jgi:hypothetical protein
MLMVELEAIREMQSLGMTSVVSPERPPSRKVL